MVNRGRYISGNKVVRMSESLKASLGGLIFLAVLADAFVWFAHGIPPTPPVWGLRIGLLLVIIGSAALLIRAARRADLAPDFLRQFLGAPFERDGFCFSVTINVQDGLCYFNIVFQNQYERACDGRVIIQAPVKSFSFNRRAFQGVALDIQCEGGALGVARMPLPIPARFQGRKMRFDVSGATRYPAGSGKLLRFKNGLRVGKADASGLGTAAAAIGLAAVGVISVKRPAGITFPLPTGVAEDGADSIEPTVETVWKPGDPTEDVRERLRQAIEPRVAKDA
jgi:hypothetical protein